MPPTALVPGQPIAPAPVNTNSLGVATPTPTAAPVPTQLPQAQAPPTAPTPASVGSPSSAAPGIMNSIANFYQIPGQTAQVVNAGQSQGNVAQQQFERQKAENDIKIQNQKDSLDPTKYVINKNSDGTLNIVNSVGDKVDLATYVNLTGSNPADVITKYGATDQADQKFVAAYNNLQAYAQAQIAAKNGDSQAQATVKQYQEANPGLANMELGQLTQAFMGQYGSYFGQPQQGAGGGNLAPGVNPTLTSENNPAALSAYENPTYANLTGGQGVAASPYVPSPTAVDNGSGSNNIASLLSSLQSQNTGQ